MLREWKMNNCIKKNLSFGIGFTVDLKIWISQVDLSDDTHARIQRGMGARTTWKIKNSIGFN